MASVKKKKKKKKKKKVSRRTLQRDYTENSEQIFPEKVLLGLSPNFHIHVSVHNLYIPTRSAYSAAGNVWTDPENI